MTEEYDSAYVGDQMEVPDVWNNMELDLDQMASVPAQNAWHRMEVKQLKFKVTGPTAKNPGAPMASLGLEIVGETDPDKGKFVWTNLVLRGKQALEMAGRFFSAIGWNLEGNRAFRSTQEFSDAVLGKTVDARTEVKSDDTYGDKAEIKAWRAPSYADVALGFVLEE